MISEKSNSENQRGLRFALIGPTYPYRGGIAHYTTLLARHLRQTYDVLLLSFSRQYPTWLFPGKSDKDPSQRPLQTEAEFILDPINPLTWRKTVKQLRNWQPNVVILPWWHPYFAFAWAWLSREIKKLPTKPKLIFICHNVLPHEQSKLSKRLLPSVLRMALGRGDGYIVHSEADAQILHKFFPKTSCKITPLPTYSELGQINNETVDLPVILPDDRPLLLFCGLIRPYKGLDVLLDAFAIALQQRPLHLLIAGEFWQGGLQSYQAQIDRLHLNGDVTILAEYLPDEQLVACMDQTDVIVLPYKSATQSAVIQMAFGRLTPVITTNVGGLAEAVCDGRTGLVVPPNDPQALATAINQYFEEDLTAVFSKNIDREHARFSWQVLIEQIRDLARD